MGKAMGQVRFPNGDIMYFEYDGNTDTCDVPLFEDESELDETRFMRNFEHEECKCGRMPTNIEIASGYGGGFHWHGTACYFCHVIVDGNDPFGNLGGDPKVVEDGLPRWWRK